MWPPEFVELKQIENLLQCGICYDYLDTSVITPCSHNYCSLCIRKYLHYKTQCPACFVEIFEKDLRINKVIDEIIISFARVKKKLLQQLLARPTREIEPNDESNTKNNSPNKQLSAINEDKNELIIKCERDNVSSPVIKASEQQISSPSTSTESRISSIFTPKSRKFQKVVTCPVCKVSVSDGSINRHLDDCLKREEIKDQLPKLKPKRKPLAKLVFRLMKDAELRRKLKEFSLTTQGDRKALEMRLQRYITVYNAECDKQDPRPVVQLIKQCEEEEMLETKANKICSSAKRLQVNRSMANNIIEHEQLKYLEAHKESFENLVKRIKNVDCDKKSTAKRVLLAQTDSSSIPQEDCIPSESHDSSEEYIINDCRPLNEIDDDLQDSKSNIVDSSRAIHKHNITHTLAALDSLVPSRQQSQKTTNVDTLMTSVSMPKNESGRNASSECCVLRTISRNNCQTEDSPDHVSVAKENIGSQFEIIENMLERNRNHKCIDNDRKHVKRKKQGMKLDPLSENQEDCISEDLTNYRQNNLHKRLKGKKSIDVDDRKYFRRSSRAKRTIIS